MARLIHATGMAEAGPSSAAQFKAIAWIRWRLFVNAFRRKGGKGEVFARIVLFPFAALITLGPSIAALGAGYFAIHRDAPWMLSLVMWAVFGGWIFITSATTLQPDSVDLSLLLRFPIRFRSYVITRFFFGLLATPNVVGSCALAAAAIGIGFARPNLFPWAALDLFVYALMMILLMRMALLWLDRWLAQRRTREIVGVLFALFFLSFQFLNAELQTWLRHRHGHHGLAKFASLLPYYHAIEPVLSALPPALAANSILRMQHGQAIPAIGALTGVTAFAGLFAGLFAYRLRGEFRGENFNEAPARAAIAREKTDTTKAGISIAGVSPAIVACIEKELRYLTRAPAGLIGILVPLVLVGIWANKLGSSELLLPGAMAYTLFSLLPTLYNVLGQDAAGAQLYLLSPTPVRLVFLSKNIVSGTLICVVAGAAGVLVSYRQPPPAPILAGTLLWFVFVLFANLSFGNFRSVSSPVKVDMGKIQRRQGQSQTSVLIVLGVLFGSLIVGFALLWGFRYLGYIWAAPAVLLVMAVAAILGYARSLGRIEEVALGNRDVLIEVLGKG